MRFEAFLVFALVLSFSLAISAQQCGKQANNTLCPNDLCCSRAGYCGSTEAYCGDGCQSQCHDLPSLISKSIFNEMFPNQNSNDCPSQGFYTYEAFLAAGVSARPFANVGDDASRKREIAAFLAQTSYETAGLHAVVPLPGRDRFVWGYCLLNEINPPSNYCNPHYACPKEYYGRGPFQLKWNKNYLECGESNSINKDLLNNPDLLVTDALVSFKSAFWFWMTPQSNNPSSHEVITGEWTPTEDDKSKGWLPGFGLTTNIINGANECGTGPNAMGATRIGYFRKYCRLLGTTTGDNLDCYDQAPIGQELLAETM